MEFTHLGQLKLSCHQMCCLSGLKHSSTWYTKQHSADEVSLKMHEMHEKLKKYSEDHSLDTFLYFWICKSLKDQVRQSQSTSMSSHTLQIMLWPHWLSSHWSHSLLEAGHMEATPGNKCLGFVDNVKCKPIESCMFMLSWNSSEWLASQKKKLFTGLVVLETKIAAFWIKIPAQGEMRSGPFQLTNSIQNCVGWFS